ncbi:MAG: hypothetical protein Q4E53_07605 [Eubacteriales bacterium]|nr:hypothetical protein [Eubacteriales bacterium]
MEQKEYLEFTRVTRNLKGYRPGKGFNEKRIFENLNNGSFRYTEGCIGVKVGIHKPKSRVYGMERWDEMVTETMEAGWHLSKTKKMEEVLVEENKTWIKDEEIRKIVERLIAFQNEYIAENTSKKIDNLPDSELEKGKQIIDYLMNHQCELTVSQFNWVYMKYLEYIPRNIKHLDSLLARSEDDYLGIIERERDFYEMILGYLKRNRKEPGKDFLMANGISMRLVTKEEKEWLQKELGNSCSLVNAWSMESKERVAVFDSFCKKHGLSNGHGIYYLKHGTRSENVLSIMINGIKIYPGKVKADVVITGKALGIGAYHAEDAEKSRGYTSINDSKWARGGNRTGFMFLNRVATGTKEMQYEPLRCDSSLTWEKLQKIKPGALSTWYHKDANVDRNFHFYKNEIVTYRDEQIDGKCYLVEFQ